MKSIKNSMIIGSVAGNVTMNGHRVVNRPTTHAEQEQLLLDYLKAYRDTINLEKWAEKAEVGVTTIKLFYGEHRGLSPEVLAKCLAYLKKQAQAMQVFA